MTYTPKMWIFYMPIYLKCGDYFFMNGNVCMHIQHSILFVNEE